MRIAIDASRTTRAQRTGTENYALQLIRALLALDSPHQFTLYFNDPPRDPAEFAKARARVIPFPRLWTHLRFAADLWRDRPDLTFVPAHTLPFVFPGRAVVTVHDLGYHHFPTAHTARARLYLELTTRWSAHRAAVILADSEATQRDLIAFYGINAAKIRVVYPGVEPFTRADQSHIDAVRAKYSLPERYLLFIGTLQPRKNIARLINAYQSWRERCPAAQVGLVLAGRKGWLSDDLPTDAPGVIVTGYVADAEVAALYSGALALVFPSLYEGFGFPMIEAMRCGTPVLCSDTSSLPELAGDAALLVDPLDESAISRGMERLIADADLRAELSARGLIQAARFTWRAAAQQTMAAFESVARA